MSALRTALAQARQHRDHGEDGFSLIETLVAMVIFSIFMSLAMAAILSMLTSSQKSQNLADGATTVENAFQKLDHQVHYADAINQVGQLGPNWFVEWHSQATSNSTELCTQLKYDATAKTLVERTWIPGPAAHATGWYQLANHIVNDVTQPAQYPFVWSGLSPIIATVPGPIAHQQLAVVLVVSPAVSTKAKSEASTLTASFTALNSSKNSGLVCQEVARS